MNYFGTDGIRGDVCELFTHDFLVNISYAISEVLKEKNIFKICLGQDPRISSNYISNTMIGVFLSKGIDVEFLGVVSTPIISYTIVSDDSIDMGIMISASHNVYSDNGIKIFGVDGRKISSEIEENIEEKFIRKNFSENLLKIGKFRFEDKYLNNYKEYLKSIGRDFSNFKIALDCSNGSATSIAPSIFKELGAEVLEIGNNPDGYNINDNVGSTNINNLCNFMKKNSVDFGFSYDGDADRVILVNKNGEVLDGDYILYILANYLFKEGKLKNNKVAITVMSNMCLKEGLDKMGVKYVECQVGDKYVMRKLDDENLNLGGEQSGHIILPDLLPTGDGIMISVILAKVIKDSKLDLVDILNKMPKYPQKLVNVEVLDKKIIMENKEFLESIKSLNDRLKGEGRILVRASGTENLIRVMTENKKKDTCNEICDIILEKINSL